MVIIGVLAAVVLIGLVTPGAEESDAVSAEYGRTAYWACADVLTQRVGPAIDLDFPGHETATITNQGQTWDVSGPVDMTRDLEPTARTWRCTITQDDGDWRGNAVLE